MKFALKVKCETCDGYGERQPPKWKTGDSVKCLVCDGTGVVSNPQIAAKQVVEAMREMIPSPTLAAKRTSRSKKVEKKPARKSTKRLSAKARKKAVATAATKSEHKPRKATSPLGLIRKSDPGNWREIVRKALKEAGSVPSGAKSLGVSVPTLYTWLEQERQNGNPLEKGISLRRPGRQANAQA